MLVETWDGCFAAGVPQTARSFTMNDLLLLSKAFRHGHEMTLWN